MNKSRLPFLIAALGASMAHEIPLPKVKRTCILSQDELDACVKERISRAQEKRLRKAEKRKPIIL